MVYSVLEGQFRKYGRVISDVDTTEILEVMDNYIIPEDVVYEPSDKVLEKTAIHKIMEESIYGGSPVQTGYCNGHNQLLNALEYHRSSEINIAATDLILLLGKREDMEEDFTYDTSKVEAFKVPRGTTVELYATTLHYAPCGINGAGFRCVVVLPKGTNLEVSNKHITEEDKLLAASNKWLIAHEDAHIDGAFNGLRGTNIRM